MNYKLIMLPNPLLVSGEEITFGDFYFKDDKILRWSKGTSIGYIHIQPCKYPKPIIAGIEGLPKLDLSAIAEEIGWVDVEKLAVLAFQKRFNRIPVIMGSSEADSFWLNTWIDGYKAAQSLNEKKFTLSEMEQCWLQAQECVLGTDDFPMGGNNFKYPSFKEYIHSLSKPKEYNVQYIQEGNTIKVTKILS